ncbi:MAG: DUF58 domain-containing protein [Proteobacteria bacterium]|nr:MAG: DUF58 domain-containing protein [Pseudomonadota bacterium]
MIPAVARTFYRFVGGNKTVPVSLGLRNIYILPTGYGLLFLVVVGAMLIGSINYSNNLGFLLTFLLGSLGVTAMMHTYGMLYGVRLVSATARPVFAGEAALVELTIAAVNRRREHIRWYFEDQPPTVADIRPGAPARLDVKIATTRRGILDPGWLRIACDYPLGLFRAWARIRTDTTCLVYPRPVSGPAPQSTVPVKESEGDHLPVLGVDDFGGLANYQPGDPPGRIYWPAYSRGRGLYVKTFTGQAGAGLMLEMDPRLGENTEQQLSVLCFHVLRAYRRRQAYSMTLPGQQIPAGNGPRQRERCLQALALFGSS